MNANAAAFLEVVSHPPQTIPEMRLARNDNMRRTQSPEIKARVLRLAAKLAEATIGGAAQSNGWLLWPQARNGIKSLPPGQQQPHTHRTLFVPARGQDALLWRA